MWVLLYTSCKPFTKEKHSFNRPQRIAIMTSMRVCVFFCTPLANLLQKKRIRPIATNRYNVLNACVWVLLYTSCKPFTKEKHSFDRPLRIAIMTSMRVCVFFCTHLANLLQKKSIRPIATHRYNVLNACVCVHL